jgi:hypothetical protein
MTHKTTKLLILFLFFISCTHPQKAPITGLWYFDRFGGSHGEIAQDSSVIKVNMENKGLTINFTTDNKLISSQPGGLERNKFTTSYKILDDQSKIIINGDTMTIKVLTKDMLELFIDNSMTALFLNRAKPL